MCPGVENPVGCWYEKDSIRYQSFAYLSSLRLCYCFDVLRKRKSVNFRTIIDKQIRVPVISAYSRGLWPPEIRERSPFLTSMSRTLVDFVGCNTHGMQILPHSLMASLSA